MLPIFLLYFGLPVLFGRAPPALLSVPGALSAAGAAYIARIAESGLKALPAGQIQAAASLGLKRRQAARHILFPQLIANIPPSLSNQWISLLKDTSLGYISAIRSFYMLRGRRTGAAAARIRWRFTCLSAAFILSCAAG